MNFLRLPLRTALRRTYSATTRPFVPPSQLHNVEPLMNHSQRQRETLPNEGRDDVDIPLAPESPTFYTGRPEYYDQIVELEKNLGKIRGMLKRAHLLPLPEFARASLPVTNPVWMDKEEMTVVLDTKLTTGRHRKFIAVLNDLRECSTIATAAGLSQIASQIESILILFESGKKGDALARQKRKKIELDEYGRSYTIGKRKTGSARVWMIPIQPDTPAPTPETLPDDAFSDLLNLAEPIVSAATPTKRPKQPSKPIKVTTTTVLVNGLPMNEYFPLPADREAITRPLRLTGVLGAYNIFALVRGGGSTGQSGALMQAIAKGLAVHEPAVGPILKKSKLVRRDPRMVERKKTGLAKARKRYAWVKR